MNKPLQRVCRVAAWLVWATFACRALTPLGYMPASITDGGPFVLCPGGAQAELVQYFDSKHGHHAHGGHHHDAGGSSHDQHRDGSECPIGASFATAIPATLLEFAVLQPQAAQPVLLTDAPAVSAPETRYQSRAPPSRRSA
jgi:hypothetical protein